MRDIFRRGRPLTADEEARLENVFLHATTPSVYPRPSFHDELRRRLVHEATRVAQAARAGAGSLDGSGEGVGAVHLVSVATPRGGEATMADIEPIDPDRAEEVMRRAREVMERHTNVRDGRQ
jgi:hypothetical protein